MNRLTCVEGQKCRTVSHIWNEINVGSSKSVVDVATTT